MSEISGGSLIAIPYRVPDFSLLPRDLPVQSAMLDHLVTHPMWFASSLSPEEIRINAAWMMSDPSFLKWEVWNGGRFAGGIFLSHVVSPIDALFHFTFFPKKVSGVGVFGTHKLLWNFLGFAFEQFNLRRISMEVPESAPTFLKYVRQRLSFKYESELSLERFDKLKKHLTDQQEGMLSHIACFGSRKEGCHWDGKGWSDIMLLRLTRSEYLARASLGIVPMTREPKEVPDVVGIETGPVRTGTDTG
jgi:hypothetical protein